MEISAELTLSPLQDNYEELIKKFIIEFDCPESLWQVLYEREVLERNQGHTCGVLL